MTTYSCQPIVVWSSCPTSIPSAFDAMTSPMPSARITSPMATGGTYERTSLSQPRCAGSNDSHRVRSRTSPGPGSGIAASTSSKCSSVTSPVGRSRSRSCRLVPFTPDIITYGVATD